MDVDTDGCIWNADSYANIAYELDTSGSVVSSFNGPSTPIGLGIDQAGCVWLAGNDPDALFQYTTAGSPVSTLTRGSYPTGIGFDENDSLWNADNGFNPAYIYGGVRDYLISSFSTDAIHGVDQDGAGCIWALNYTDKTVVQYNQSGSAISSFNAGGNYVQDIGFDPGGSLWITDYLTNSVYQTTRDGSFITSFAFSGGNPLGVAPDGQGCIWVNNNPNQTAIKYTQSGSAITSIVGVGDGGMYVDTTGSLWGVNRDNDLIEKFDTSSGSKINQYTRQVVRPIWGFTGTGDNNWQSNNSDTVYEGTFPDTWFYGPYNKINGIGFDK